MVVLVELIVKLSESDPVKLHPSGILVIPVNEIDDVPVQPLSPQVS